MAKEVTLRQRSDAERVATFNALRLLLGYKSETEKES